MSLCPICGRVYCDHTPEERGQTNEEMMSDLTPEELKTWKSEPFSDSPKQIVVARKVREEQYRKRKTGQDSK